MQREVMLLCCLARMHVLHHVAGFVLLWVHIVLYAMCGCPHFAICLDVARGLAVVIVMMLVLSKVSRLHLHILASVLCLLGITDGMVSRRSCRPRPPLLPFVGRVRLFQGDVDASACENVYLPVDWLHAALLATC
jgi:hypothetical protein